MERERERKIVRKRKREEKRGEILYKGKQGKGQNISS